MRTEDLSARDQADVNIKETAIERKIEDAIRSIEIAPVPYKPEFAKGSERMAFIGEVPIFGAGWGTGVRTETVLSRLAEQGVLSESMELQIETLGFNNGFKYPLETDLTSEGIQHHIAGIGAELAIRTISKRDWNGVDLLLVASSTVRNDTPERIVDLLRQRNIGVSRTLWYAQACNSGFAALIDALRDEELMGKRVALVAMDTLSGTMTDVRDPISFLTFGNNGGSMAYINGVEIVHTGAGKTRVEYDSEGSIKAVPTYEIPRDGLLEPPTHYEFAGKDSKKHLFVTDQGLIMDLARSERGKLEMDGMKTFSWFVNRISPLAWDVAISYVSNPDLVERYGELGSVWSHLPSLGVVAGVNRYLLISALMAAGVEKRESRALSRLEGEKRLAGLNNFGLGNLWIPEIKWVMPDIGMNNGSAGTGFAALPYLVERNVVEQEKPILTLGFGVGSVWQADVLYFGKKSE